MELTAKAAESGSSAAGEALALLAPAAEGPRAQAAAVDLAAWLAPPPPRMLSSSPHVLTVPGFLEPRLCRALIDRARPRLGRAQVYGAATGAGVVEEARSNSAASMGLEHTDLMLVLLRERIARLAGLPVAGLEPTQILHYGVGQAFDWHVDYLDAGDPATAGDLAARGQRIATTLVLLNADFEGGETGFSATGARYRCGEGDALLWANVTPDGRADPRSRHAGLPPTRGEKWVLSQWLRPRR